MKKEFRHGGELVRHYRRAKGWSQEQLAARINVSREAVSRLERGAAADRMTLVQRALRALGFGLLITITIEDAKP